MSNNRKVNSSKDNRAPMHKLVVIASKAKAKIELSEKEKNLVSAAVELRLIRNWDDFVAHCKRTYGTPKQIERRKAKSTPKIAAMCDGSTQTNDVEGMPASHVSKSIPSVKSTEPKPVVQPPPPVVKDVVKDVPKQPVQVPPPPAPSNAPSKKESVVTTSSDVVPMKNAVDPRSILGQVKRICKLKHEGKSSAKGDNKIIKLAIELKLFDNFDTYYQSYVDKLPKPKVEKQVNKQVVKEKQLASIPKIDKQFVIKYDNLYALNLDDLCQLIFDCLKPMYPTVAQKITGMFNELGVELVRVLVRYPQELRRKTIEAVRALNLGLSKEDAYPYPAMTAEEMGIFHISPYDSMSRDLLITKASIVLGKISFHKSISEYDKQLLSYCFENGYLDKNVVQGDAIEFDPENPPIVSGADSVGRLFCFTNFHYKTLEFDTTKTYLRFMALRCQSKNWYCVEEHDKPYIKDAFHNLKLFTNYSDFMKSYDTSIEDGSYGDESMKLRNVYLMLTEANKLKHYYYTYYKKYSCGELIGEMKSEDGATVIDYYHELRRIQSLKKPKAHIEVVNDIVESRDFTTIVDNTLSALGLPVEVEYAVGSRKESHNGLRIYDSIINNALCMSKGKVMTPGRNINDMHKQNAHPNMMTYIRDKKLAHDWEIAIVNRLTREKVSEPQKAARDFIEAHTKPDFDCIFISQDFSKYYQNLYNPNRDFALVPSFVTRKDLVKIDSPLYFNGIKVGEAHVTSLNPLVMSSQMIGNQRVYNDIFLPKFITKLRSQKSIDLGGYTFYYPGTIKFNDCLVDQSVRIEGLLGDLRDLIYEDVERIRYHAFGPWSSHCWYEALVEGMKRQHDDIGRLRNTVVNILRQTGKMGSAGLVSTALGTRVVPPVGQRDIVYDQLPSGLNNLEYIHLFIYLARYYPDYTFCLHISRINSIKDSKISSVDYTDYIFGQGDKHLHVLVLIDREKTTFKTGAHAYYLEPFNYMAAMRTNFCILDDEGLSNLINNFSQVIDFYPGRMEGELHARDPVNLTEDIFHIPSISFFRRALDAGLNYRELDPFTYPRYPDYSPRYILSLDSIFPCKLQDKDYKVYAHYADREYLDSLLGMNNYNTRRVYVKFGHVDELFHQARHLVYRSIWQRLNDYFYFNCASHDRRRIETNKTNERTVPLIVAPKIIDEFYKCINMQRPVQAFYRWLKTNLEGLVSSGITNSVICDTLTYIRLLPDAEKLILKSSIAGVVNCVDIPSNAKAVASMGVKPIKLDSYGSFESDHNFYIMFDPPSYLLYDKVFVYYDRGHQNVVDSATFNRVCLGRPEQKVDSSVVYQSFHDFFEYLMPDIEDAHYLSHDELVETHPRGKLYKDHNIDTDTAKEQVSSGFVKSEAYPMEDNGTGGKEAPPRGIISPGKDSTEYGLRYTHLIEHYLKRNRHFSKAKNFKEVAQDLKFIWDNFENPCAIGCDFTQFENGISSTVLACSMAIYNYLSGMPIDYIEAWLEKKIFFGKSWLIHEIAKRISGEYQTSLGNMLIVGAILYHIKKISEYYVDWYSAGDDCILFCEAEHVSDLQSKILSVVHSFGMLIKVEKIYTEFDTIHFCQQYPVETDQGWIMINDLTRVLDKLATQPKPLEHTKLAYNRLGCLGDYINYLFGSLDWLKPLISKLQSYKPFKYHYFSKAFNTSSNWNLLALAKDTHYFTDPGFKILDPERMYEVMGFPKSLCAYYESYFKDWNPYQYINNYVCAEHVVEDGQIRFQIGDYCLYNITPKFHETDLEHPTFVKEDISLNRLSDSLYTILTKLFN